METPSRTCGIILSTHQRASIVAARRCEPWAAIAQLLDECLGDFDLTDPTNFGTTLLIDGIDFTFLLPELPDGEFATISSLVSMYAQKLRGMGELSFEMQNRYVRFTYRIGRLMTQVYYEARREGSIAA